MTYSGFACWRSHRQAWTSIANGLGLYGIVMENDADLTKHKKPFLKIDCWISINTPVRNL